MFHVRSAVEGSAVDVARAYRLLTRARLAGYDPQTRSFRPWHRLIRYSVKFRGSRGIAHFLGGSIALTDPTDQCPHVVLHDFVHEVGHAQLLLLDGAVLVVVIPELSGATWYWYIVVFLVWQFAWRELVADLYAALVLGLRDTWLGYAHIDRRARRVGVRPKRVDPPKATGIGG